MNGLMYCTVLYCTVAFWMRCNRNEQKGLFLAKGLFGRLPTLYQISSVTYRDDVCLKPLFLVCLIEPLFLVST